MKQKAIPKLEFEVGRPILWKSDLRYAARIEKLKIVDYLASDLTNARSFVELDTSNILFMIEYKNSKVYDSIKKDKNYLDLAPALEQNLVSVIPDEKNELLRVALWHRWLVILVILNGKTLIKKPL